MRRTSCNVSVKTWGNFLELKFFELFEALYTCDENAYFMSITTNGSKKIENQSCHCAQTGTINPGYQIRQNSRIHQPIAIEFGKERKTLIPETHTEFLLERKKKKFFDHKRCCKRIFVRRNQFGATPPMPSSASRCNFTYSGYSKDEYPEQVLHL